MKQEGDNLADKKRVLFLGMTDFNLSKDDLALEKKLLTLNKDIVSFIVARGLVWKMEKYGTKFFLTPKKWGLPIWFVISFFRCFTLIKKEKIDVIISQSPSMDGVLAALLKLVTGKQLIVEVHGDWVESLFFYHKLQFEGVYRWLFTFFGKISLKSADKVRVISSFTEKLARRYSGDKPYYKFPTFTDINVFLQEKNISWDLSILYVGVLYRLKGVHFLIEALKKIQSKHPQVKLVIVGEGPFKKELDDLIARLDVKNVEFTGRLFIEGVVEQMKKCTVLVLPSLSEGLGRVLIEAAALGKPLIGSDTGGIPDIVHNGVNGFLFEPGNVDELAEKLDLIFSDLEKAKVMGAKGKELVSAEYSTEKYFSDYLKMIED
jgi:glycosyltransferase involved in cell wall biosynthesis